MTSADTVTTPAQAEDAQLGAAVRQLVERVALPSGLVPSVTDMAQVMVDAAAQLVADVEVLIAADAVDDPDHFRVVAGAGRWATTWLGESWPVKGSLQGCAMVTGKIIETDNAPNETVLTQVFQAGGIETGRLVPVTSPTPMADGRTGRVVMSFWRRGRRPFTPAERRLIDTYSQLAGMTLIYDQFTRASEQAKQLATTEAAKHREHAQRIAELEQVKSEFLNLASHELRGPLAVLRGYISMLSDGTLGDQDLGRVVPVLAAKVEQMNLLVNEMLETARLEEGRVDIQARVHDLREVLDESIASMRPVLTQRHQLRIRVPQEAVPVRVDAGRIATVLGNLIDNAIKYSPHGGVVRCTLTRRGEWAYVSVSDEGLGIAADDMPKLFSRFGRLVTSENSHISGTGLGLYLSQELARLNGGHIRARSRAGAGSAFTLALPVAGKTDVGARRKRRRGRA